MTPQEALTMQGTEFIYVFEDGDTMPAYVKKVDLERMIMSCWSFSLITGQGYGFDPMDEDEEIEQACCLSIPHGWEKIHDYLIQIKETGKFIQSAKKSRSYGYFPGCSL